MSEPDPDAPNFIVPRIPGTAVLAAVGGLLLLAVVAVAVLRVARGQTLIPEDRTSEGVDADPVDAGPANAADNLPRDPVP